MGVTAAPARLAEGDPAASAHFCSGSFTWVKRRGGLSGHKSDHITLPCFNPKPRLRARDLQGSLPPPPPGSPSASAGLSHGVASPDRLSSADPARWPLTTGIPGHWFATGLGHCTPTPPGQESFVSLKKREGESEKERSGKILRGALFHNSGYRTLGYVEGIIKTVS